MEIVEWQHNFYNLHLEFPIIIYECTCYEGSSTYWIIQTGREIIVSGCKIKFNEHSNIDKIVCYCVY